MPEIRPVPVTAARLHKGDMLADGRTVQSNDPKIKWTTVYFEDGTKIRVLSDYHYDVLRSFKTPEEDAADRKAFALRQLDNNERGAAEQLDKIREKIATQLLDGQHITHWDMGSLAEAQATQGIWGRITHVHLMRTLTAIENLWNAEVGDEPIASWEVELQSTGNDFPTRMEVAGWIREDVEKKLLEHTRFTSRSTSIMSNVMEDYDSEAQAKFLRDWRWMAF